MNKPMAGAAGTISAAAGSQPHSRPEGKSKVNTGSVGNETKANVRGAQEPSNHLGGAVAELKRQHPIAHDDLGPHHNRSDHIRHRPHVRPGRG